MLLDCPLYKDHLKALIYSDGKLPGKAVTVLWVPRSCIEPRLRFDSGAILQIDPRRVGMYPQAASVKQRSGS